MYTPHTVTVINAYASGGAMAYAATVLSGVFLDTSHSALAQSLGAKDADNAVLFIPADVTAAGKTFATPKAYAAAEDKSALWTLQEAGDSSAAVCFFVRGEAEAMSYKQARETYDDVFRVKTVLARDFGSADMRHWEVHGV